MKRRTFIYLSFATAAGMGAPFVSCRNKSAALNKILAQPKFLSHICDAKTLREIGKVYKEEFPSESKKEQLANELLTDNSGKSFAETADQSSISSLLDQKIKQDFETGKTVVVKGWVLSATEAQQCALFSLT